MMTETRSFPRLPLPFPPHRDRRVWLISSGDNPIGLSVARQVLAHGDYVVSGLIPSNILRDENRRDYFEDFLAEVERNEGNGWKDRFRTCILDIRKMGECQAAVAEAVSLFGRLDIVLCCTSQAVVGSVEELGTSSRTLSLVRDQFETNYFGPVNIIKSALPQMRKQREGHFLVVTGITAHLGTPGLGVYCASEWALEGFCDSIAYEVAPFNIKMSILQCSMEICILTNLISSVPPILPAYSTSENSAPLFRNLLDGLLSQLPQATDTFGSGQDHQQQNLTPSSNSNSEPRQTGPFSSQEVVSMYAPFSAPHLDALILETVHAITAIGGHENPPSRHIIGQEGVAAVKEKLKTVSEELEDFVQASYSINIHESNNEEDFSGDIM